MDEICKLQKQKRAYETHLQLYFTESIGFNSNLNPVVGNNLIWFGNEVPCGVGMQKIDILTICQNAGRKEFRLIELKDEAVQPEVIDQIEYYVNWASQDSGRHLDDAFHWNIQPVIVAPPHNQRNWQDVLEVSRNYNKKQLSLPIIYFEFKIECRKTIIFEQKGY